MTFSFSCSLIMRLRSFLFLFFSPFLVFIPFSISLFFFSFFSLLFPGGHRMEWTSNATLAQNLNSVRKSFCLKCVFHLVLFDHHRKEKHRANWFLTEPRCLFEGKRERKKYCCFVTFYSLVTPFSIVVITRD